MLLFCVDEIIVVLGFFSFREKKATGQTWKEELAFRGRGSTAPVFLRSRVARSRAGQLDSGEGVLRRKLALGDPWWWDLRSDVYWPFLSPLFLPWKFFLCSQVCSKVKHWGCDWHFLGERKGRTTFIFCVGEAHSSNPLLSTRPFVVCLFKNEHLKKDPILIPYDYYSLSSSVNLYSIGSRMQNCNKSQGVVLLKGLL